MALDRKRSNDDIFSFTIRNYGNLDYISEVLTLNNFDELSDFDDIQIGSYVTISGIFFGFESLDFPSYNINYSQYSKMNTKKPNQNVFDYVLTQYGSLDGLYNFITSNDIDRIGFSGGFNNFDTKPIGTSFIIENVENNPFLDLLEDSRRYIATNSEFNNVGDYDDSYNDDYF